MNIMLNVHTVCEDEQFTIHNATTKSVFYIYGICNMHFIQLWIVSSKLENWTNIKVHWPCWHQSNGLQPRQNTKEICLTCHSIRSDISLFSQHQTNLENRDRQFCWKMIKIIRKCSGFTGKKRRKMSTFWWFDVDWLVFQKRPKLCNLTITNVVVVQTKKLTQFIQMFVANILTSYLRNIIQWRGNSAQKFAIPFENVQLFPLIFIHP